MGRRLDVKATWPVIIGRVKAFFTDVLPRACRAVVAAAGAVVSRRTWSVAAVAAKRLLSRRWLTLATALGLIVSVTLATSTSMYADAVYYRVLLEELAGREEGARHSPFAFMFRYVGSWEALLEWEDVREADEYLSRSAVRTLGLPQEFVVRYFRTTNLRLFPRDQTAYSVLDDELAWVGFGFASDLQEHVVIKPGGEFPAAAPPTADSTVEVLISDHLATRTGMQMGEAYTVYLLRETEYGDRTTRIPVRIAGVWQARDPTEEYWFYSQASFEDVLFVPEETFVGRISPYVEEEIDAALWYLVLDGSGVHTGDVNPLLSRINAIQQRVSAFLPGTRLEVHPRDELDRYRAAAGRLTLMLYAYSVPITGLVLAFIGLVVGLAVSRQRNEIAVLRSRGATMAQVVGIAVLEGTLLGLIALVVSLPAGSLAAHLIGKTRSFLDFGLESDLRVDVTITAVQLGIAAGVLALVAQVLPTISAARHTVVSYKQDRARSMRWPWWQRAWLDLLLLIPAAYGAYLLRRQGSLVVQGGEGAVAADPFQNPLLFLVPALGVFSLTLFILRILPLLMSGLSRIAARTGRVGVLMAARHLARTPGFYSAPLLLLVLTLSLSTFTASLAETLDTHLYDREYYEAGGDLRVAEWPPDLWREPLLAYSLPAPAGSSGIPGPRWLHRPVSDHLELEGVERVTRVARYQATAQLIGGVQRGLFYGIDYFDFDRIAFWRDDFAEASLGELRNALGATPEGVLVPRSFMSRNSLEIGDVFHVVTTVDGMSPEMDVQIVGHFEYFPAWYPGEDGPLFVGNLDYLSEMAREQVPYHVWMTTAPDADTATIVSGVRDLWYTTAYWESARDDILAEQRRPERQGLFGVLSVGFLAAAVLTVLGFLYYAFFSFRRRFIELGILRAVGLSTGQMTVFLAWELAFLVLVGLIAGTVLGVWVSAFFIPSLQLGGEAAAQVPPFDVKIAWGAVWRIYGLFILLFVAALGVLVALLKRIRIFEAVKLGDTT